MPKLRTTLAQNYTLRMPAEWAAGLRFPVNPQNCKTMLEKYLRQPRPLAPDPGPGDFQATLYLPRVPMNILAAATDSKNPAAALRRLIATEYGARPELAAPGGANLYVIQKQTENLTSSHGFSAMAARMPAAVDVFRPAQPRKPAGNLAPYRPIKRGPSAIPTYQYWAFSALLLTVIWRLLFRGSAGSPEQAMTTAAKSATAFREWVPLA